MNLLFLKRFLRGPARIAAIVPSSRFLNRKLMERLHFSQNKIFVEFGGGEGVHTREVVKLASKDSKILVFELDPEFYQHLTKQFQGDSRIKVLNEDARNLTTRLKEEDVYGKVDVLFSGIPFSLMDKPSKLKLLEDIHSSLRPEGSFVMYQNTTELHRFADLRFKRVHSEYCLLNIPPMFISEFVKTT